MSALVSDRDRRPRTSGAPPVWASAAVSRRPEGLAAAWGRARPWLLLVWPIGFAVVALVVAGFAIRGELVNGVIHALRSNKDIGVSTSASSAALLARIEFLLDHDRTEEVQPYVEAIDKSGAISTRAIAHYDLANGRLRQAFDKISDDKLDDAGPLVVLARQEYRRALTLAPDDWDAKFNLDVASRLIRDFPSFERTIGDAVPTDRKKLWTDVPGKPEGLP